MISFQRSVPKPIVYLGELIDDPGEPSMKFRLTYEGELRPTQRDPEDGQKNPLAMHKQNIRREFHQQLKQLWENNKFLQGHKVQGGGHGFFPNAGERSALVDAIADDYRQFGYRFVPLALERFSLSCSLDVLFLRRDMPGSTFTAGDIDNRIKTLIDALRCPKNASELIETDSTPQEGEDPFYCLLEDDKLIGHFSVETDTLLDPPELGDRFDQRRAKVIITVQLYPYGDITMFNLGFI